MAIQIKTLTGLVNAALHTKTTGGIVPLNLHKKTADGIVSVAGNAAQYMRLGMNLGWITSYSDGWTFANLMYHTGVADRASGAGTITSRDQGKFTTSDTETVWRIKFADSPDTLPVGTYTVRNPAGDTLAIGDWNAPSSGAFTTASEFTFDITGLETAAKSLFCKGGISGNVAIIAPGHTESWDAGNVWHEDFLSYMQAMKLKVLRTMDWTWASQNIESEWSHRSVVGKVNFYTPGANAPCIPYELICDLAGRLGADPWVCVPHRATDDYVEQMAVVFSEHLPAGRRVWLEHGNEVWNNGSPWAYGTNWLTLRNFTKRTATCDVPNNRFYLPDHGLTDGTPVSVFDSIDTREAGISPSWRISYGGTTYAKRIDSDYFEAHSAVGLTDRIPLTVGMTTAIVVNRTEAGKSENMNGNFGTACLRDWDAFDAALGASRVVHIVASQAANPAISTARLAVAGVADRADHIAIAPYFDGDWWGAACVSAAGQVTPQVWASNSRTVYISTYAHGATPTVADVVAGAGAVSSQSYTYTAGSNTYSSATAITGLTDGTTYDVHFVLIDGNGHKYRIVVESTPGAAATTYGYDSYENQATRNRLSSTVPYVSNHAAVAPDIPVICYEGGLHFHHSAPAVMKAWLSEYQESPEFADTIKRDLWTKAASGAKLHCYYQSVAGTSFQISNSYQDTDDLRYQAFVGLAGKAVVTPPVAVENILADTVATAPGAFPHTIATLPDGLTYSIVSGDDVGNFSILGNQLVLLNDNTVNWSAPSSRVLTIEASNGFALGSFSVSFAIGQAWYEADAVFAWSPVGVTDTSDIVPVIGGTLSRTAGTGAAVEADLWRMTGNVYSSSTALTAQIALTTPLLFAVVADMSSQSINYARIAQAGSGNNLYLYKDGPTGSVFTGYMNSPGASITGVASSNITGLKVRWMYFDGANTFTQGANQTDLGAVTNAAWSANMLARNMAVGSDTSTPKSTSLHGAIQVISRTGMTLADAKAIVAKMQAHHGIA